MAWIAQLEGDLHELRGKLDFSKRHNNVADLRYSTRTYECDSLKPEIASGKVYNQEMVKRLARASQAAGASIGAWNRYAALARKQIEKPFAINLSHQRSIPRHFLAGGFNFV